MVRIEPEKKWHQDPQQSERKPETFTVMFRHGETGNRIEKYVSGILNHVLTQRNRENPGILMWRAKTLAEKRPRAQQAAGLGAAKARDAVAVVRRGA